MRECPKRFAPPYQNNAQPSNSGGKGPGKYPQPPRKGDKGAGKGGKGNKGDIKKPGGKGKARPKGGKPGVKAVDGQEEENGETEDGQEAYPEDYDHSNEGYDEQVCDWDWNNWNEWNQAENQEDAAEPQQDSTSVGDLRAQVTKLVLDQMRTFAKEEDLEAKESTILNAGAVTVLSTQGNPFKI